MLQTAFFSYNCNILEELNSYDDRIQFTHEIAKDNFIPFLAVMISWKEDNFEMTLYRKETYNDPYIHWETQAPTKWKRSTLNW